MKTIYKYNLNVTDFQTISIPKDSEILDFQFQQGKICMWCIIDTEQTEKMSKDFYMFGTGHEIDEDLSRYLYYTKTIQMYNLVWHIFEKFEKRIRPYNTVDPKFTGDFINED